MPSVATPAADTRGSEQSTDDVADEKRRRSSVAMELIGAFEEVSGFSGVSRRVIAGFLFCIGIYVGQYYLWRNNSVGFIIINVVVHPVLQVRPNERRRVYRSPV
jgi:hypothetical protein